MPIISSPHLYHDIPLPEMLTRHFKKYGEIIDSVIMKNRSTGHPRGFGFVTFADPSIVDIALKDTHILDGKMVR